MNTDIVMVAKELIGKTVSNIEGPHYCNEGVIITFSDGTTLSCGWSACEGIAKLNDKEINL